MFENNTVSNNLRDGDKIVDTIYLRYLVYNISTMHVQLIAAGPLGQVISLQLVDNCLRENNTAESEFTSAQ